MKAAQLVKYGGQDSISLNEVPKPAVSKGEVLVEVYAAGVNPFDVKVRDGAFRASIPLSLPITQGGDVAGTVAEVGEGVSGFELGQAVYGSADAVGGHGSFAEFTSVTSEQLAAKPPNIDFEAAAALPLTASAAYQAIVENIDPQNGQKILIHGGAGGIGSLAIQLAKHRGAYVVTTVSAADIDFVKSLGADEAIDYKKQDFSKIVQEYDAVFDTVGGETNAKSYRVLKKGGTLISMTEQPDEARVAERELSYTQQNSRATTERLSEIATLIEAGQLTVNVDKIFSLEQADEALEYLKSQHTRGKVVIKIKK